MKDQASPVRGPGYVMVRVANEYMMYGDVCSTLFISWSPTRPAKQCAKPVVMGVLAASDVSLWLEQRDLAIYNGADP